MLLITAAPVAMAAEYPPTTEVKGTVSPTRIQAGGCAVFSGEGFSPNVTIEVRDNGAARGTSQTDENGEFAKQLCYDADTQAGKHTLTGTGDAPDSAAVSSSRSLFRLQTAHAAVRRTVTAILYVTGVTQTDPGDDDGDGGGTSLPRTDDGAAAGGGIPFTGFPALVAALVGTALVAVGGALLVGAEQRHRRRRRLA